VRGADSFVILAAAGFGELLEDNKDLATIAERKTDEMKR